MKKLMYVALIVLCCGFVQTKTFAQFAVSVGVVIHTPPPPLVVYVQPPCPVDGYLWTPGYWAYGDLGYYWVPGVWVAPPSIGLLWTPGYWGYVGGVYGWHAGYWGPHVGFYGGVNYGFGFGGVGFVGGMWQGGYFHYNTAVVNVNTTVVHNTYINRTVVNNTTVVNNRASFNGPGGVSARPTSAEVSAMNEHHFQPTSQQFAHNETMRQDRNQLASVNGGRPATTAMSSVNGNRFNQRGSAPAGYSHSHPASSIEPNNQGSLGNHTSPNRVHTSPNNVHPSPNNAHPNYAHPSPSNVNRNEDHAHNHNPAPQPHGGDGNHHHER